MSERIASKIRTEHALQHDIMGTEKSYRELRSSTDNLEHNIKEKEISVSVQALDESTWGQNVRV